jgi:hypothetical protein
MIATHLEDGLHEGLGGFGGRPAAGVVRRRQRVEAAVQKPTPQVTHRACGQAEGRGNGGNILPVLEPLPDRLTDGEGNGARHGSNSGRKPWR